MNERLLISLVGMSGIGKSYWSKNLEQYGFERFGCDDLIVKALGYSGIQDVAKWMGYPFDPQYKDTSKQYLKMEEEVMNGIMEEIERSEAQRVVIDTTGSLVYLGESILDRLSAMTHVVYLETPPDDLKKMYDVFLAFPKPIIWGTSFRQIDGEGGKEALERCYPDLLTYRTKRYRELAHITLRYEDLHTPGFTTEQFIQAITR